MVRKKAKKKSVRSKKRKVGRLIVNSSTVVGCEDKEVGEIIGGIYEYTGKPCIVRKKPRKRRGFIQDVPLSERFLKLAHKTTVRGNICRMLLKEGEISREEYKKYNRWGDIRFMAEFVDEDTREGEVFYVMKKELRSEVANIMRNTKK